VAMLGRELPDGAEVSFLSALAHNGELKILMHPPTKRGSHVWVLSQNVKKQPQRGTFGHSVDRCQSRADRSGYR
jgi:hypothetical protein